MSDLKTFRPRKPLRAEKILIGKAGLDWKAWSVCGDTATVLMLTNRFNGETRTIEKVQHGNKKASIWR